MGSHEQKYKDALEKAKAFDLPEYKNIMISIFPELKEEEDENKRIRNNCIHFLELQKTHHASTIEIEECINWLEKQSEKQFVYVVTRCEEHSDYVEKVFLDKEKAEAYCKQFNENEDCYRRHITKIKIEK